MTATSKSLTARRDIHAEITNQLIAAIESDPGHLPCRGGVLPAHCSCRPMP